MRNIYCSIFQLYKNHKTDKKPFECLIFFMFINLLNSHIQVTNTNLLNNSFCKNNQILNIILYECEIL